jgi:hypothetical protein
LHDAAEQEIRRDIPPSDPVARRIRMIRNLFASLVVALSLGTVSAVLAQEIVPANHSHGGPVVVTEGTCGGGSCQSCSPCVRVPIKIENIEYCSKCKEKCAGTCSFFGFLSGHCGCASGSCEGGDCQTYCVRRLYKRVVTEETCDTKCVHVSELPAAAPVLVVTVPAAAPAAVPAPSAMPKAH